MLSFITPEEYTPNHENIQNTKKILFKNKHIIDIKYTAGFYVIKRAEHYINFNPISIYYLKQYNIIAFNNNTIINIIANASEFNTKPAIIIAIYDKNVNAIKKYIVGLGNNRVNATNPTESAEDSTNIPTIGPTIFAITYPKPVILF